MVRSSESEGITNIPDTPIRYTNGADRIGYRTRGAITDQVGLFCGMKSIGSKTLTLVPCSRYQFDTFVAASRSDCPINSKVLIE